MSVSSVNAGFDANRFTQPALKNGLPQRANIVPSSASAPGDATPAGPVGPQSAVGSFAGPINHASRVGVAAYAAIMNPEVSTSMRTEA
ncbi:MAG: hypothetical protein ACHP7O_06000 [Burkholderiales bacterium]